MDVHLVLRTARSFVLLFVVGKISISLGATWLNCTTSSCQTFFIHSQCNSSCLCGVSTNKSTCTTPPNVIANQTDSGLNATHGNLSCCRCPSNNTFCCKTCPSSSVIATTTPSLPLHPTTISTSLPLQPATTSASDTAYLTVVFITDCNKYLPKKEQVTMSFSHVIANLTSTAVDFINMTCSTGAQPYCGVDVSNLINAEQTVGSVQCSSILVTVILKSNPRDLRNGVDKLRTWIQLGNLFVQLEDSSKIKVSFLISRFSNTSNALHQGKLIPTTSIPSRTTIPPIVVNIWPLIYSGIGVGSFLLLCIVYQCAKQSYYLRKKKFTTINSNRVNSRKKKVEEAMENQQNPDKDQVGFDMTLDRLPVVDNDTLTRRYDWTSPGYLPSMLAPAYSETHGQHSPPRLMLDDDDSEGERRSIGKASVVNVDEETDEDLREILESEDEDETRPNTRQSYISGRNKSRNKRKHSTASRTNQGKSRICSAQMTPPTNVRRLSFGGQGDGKRSPRLSYGNVRSNRVTPIDNIRKPSVSSLKPKKIVDSMC